MIHYNTIIEILVVVWYLCGFIPIIWYARKQTWPIKWGPIALISVMGPVAALIILTDDGGSA